MQPFVEQLLKRRSVYSIDNSIPIGDDELDEMLRTILQNMPSAFNMQSQRAVLLLGENHTKLWQIVLETIRARKGIVAESTQNKLAGFAAGHGTVLFFDDNATTQKYMDEFASMAENFPPWTLQQNGMLQYAVWTAFATLGIGASLQHYNPIIDDAVKAEFGLPDSWKLLAQMPFGTVTGPPDEKEFVPIAERYRRLG